MKVRSNKVEPEFKPVKLEITLESRYELEAMYALFNFAPIVSALESVEISAHRIRDSIRDGSMYITGSGQTLFNAIEKNTKRLP